MRVCVRVIYIFSTTLAANGQNTRLTMTLYLIEENGGVPLYGEMVRVERGQVKFSVEINDWTFCAETEDGPNPCGDNYVKTYFFSYFIKPFEYD